MRHRNPEETRARLLRAAVEQISEHGILDLTLDQVAAAAGVSKGGLLHHFPSKLALLEGLAGMLAHEYIARVGAEYEREPTGSRGRWARAYMRATFETPEWEIKLSNALVGALGSYPELLEIYSRAFAALDVQHDDGLPPARQLLIRMACDGLALADFSGSPPIDAALRAALFEELMELSQ
jgi:AcrR family transcriptional regulator